LLLLLPQWFAGCLFFLSRSNATVRDSLFRNNTAATAGGAIHVDRGANVQVFNTNFENNTVCYVAAGWAAGAGP
jgi:predicted outer membrane repeat protein